MNEHDLNQKLPASVKRLLTSIEELPAIRRLDRGVLPSHENATASIERLMQLIFPGYFGKQGLTHEALPFRVGEVVMELSNQLYDQIRFCLRYRVDEPNGGSYESQCQDCDKNAAAITLAFFDQLPEVRAMIAQDVQAAFDSDPAATTPDETIFCYPGLYAITVQRLAHVLYEMKVPLLPRIWTEIAHSRTGIDMHPGATLGKRFFIDHGTGVVIGETCTIGDNVKIYQGVTLGALAPHYGQQLRGTKRHPTIEDDVVIYAGATVLGGDTVIGKGSTILGNVFIFNSVPPQNVVGIEPPKLKIRDRSKKNRDAATDVMDFQI
jgi:serine O-acetyltransferase